MAITIFTVAMNIMYTLGLIGSARILYGTKPVKQFSKLEILSAAALLIAIELIRMYGDTVITPLIASA